MGTWAHGLHTTCSQDILTNARQAQEIRQVNDPHVGLSGLWPSILVGEGIDADLLDGKQHPCPICGGKDRFKFDDKGMGLWYCNHCGAGDGFGLLMSKFGLTFVQAKEVCTKYGSLSGDSRHARAPMSDATKRELMNKTWTHAAPEALPLREYLSSRGIMEVLQFNPPLRWHPDLLCTNGGHRSPAILIKYYRWGIDGKPEPATLQRHWPNLGTKMLMPAPIKLDGIFCPLGGKPKHGHLGVCEGYITALSCMALQPVPGMMPVWSCLSAEQLMKFMPPPDVKMLYIYIDVDKSYTGQAAGYALAKRLRTIRPDLETVVCYPTHVQNVDYDFNDLLKGVPCHRSSSERVVDADAATGIASPESPSQNIPMIIGASNSAINAIRDTIDSIPFDRMDASTPEKPVDAATTPFLIGEVHFTAHTTLDLPQP
jgi:putative DNA primase/helicase